MDDKTSFEPSRAVQIRATRFGSGYIIGGQLVLTAAHLFSSDDVHCQVRSDVFGDTDAKLLWVDRELDIALLKIPEFLGVWPSVEFGELPSFKEATVLGFDFYCWPSWAFTRISKQKTSSGGRHITGNIFLSDSSPQDLIVLDVDRVPSYTETGTGSPWKGASGAAVFCSGYLVGVQRQQSNPKDIRSLEASPVSKILRSQALLKYMLDHGIDGECVELSNFNRSRSPVYVPRLPDHFVEPEEDIKKICDLLCHPDRSLVSIVGLQGMGGIGKTILAAAVCKVKRIRERFCDGIVWVRFGAPSDLNSLSRRVLQIIQAIEASDVYYEDVQLAQSRLSSMSSNKKLLVVADDVHNVKQLNCLSRLGGDCRVLATTRDASILRSMDCRKHSIDVMTTTQASKLIAKAAKVQVEELPRLAFDIIEECGHLPLAIAMAGGAARGPRRRWQETLDSIRNADLAKLKTWFPDYPHDNLLSALEACVNMLDSNHRDRYLESAVFVRSSRISELAFRALWQRTGLSEIECQDLLDRLVDLALISKDSQGEYGFHDLQMDYIQIRVEVDKCIEERLLAGFDEIEIETRNRDHYYLSCLPTHLASLSQKDRLGAVLSDFEWIQAKISLVGMAETLLDFELELIPKDIVKLGKALRLAAPEISIDTNQAARQLLSRLCYPLSERLLNLIKQCSKLCGILQPSWASLAIPEEAMRSAIRSEQTDVTNLLVTEDHLVITTTRDGQLGIWDFNSGETKVSMPCKADSHLTISRNGKYAVFELETGHVKWIDLRKPSRTSQAQVLHSEISCLTISDEHNKIFVGFENGEIQVICMSSETILATFRFHGDAILEIEVCRDVCRFVTTSEDRTIATWVFAGMSPLAVFKLHNFAVSAIYVSDDGRTVASAGLNNQLYVWNFETGKVIAALSALSPTPTDHQIETTVHDTIVRVMRRNGMELVEIDNDAELVTMGLNSTVLASVVALLEESWQFAPDREHLDIADVQSVSDLCRACRDFLLEPEAKINQLALNDNCDSVFYSVGNLLKCWKFNERDDFTLSGHFDQLTCWAIDCHEKHAMTASFDGDMAVWDLQSEEMLQSGRVHRERISKCAFSPDGNFAVTCADDQYIKVWRMANDEKSIGKYPLKEVSCLTTIDAQRLVVFGHRQGGISLFDYMNGRLVSRFIGHTDIVTRVLAHQNGRLFLSSSMDGEIFVWDAVDACILGKLQGHENTVTCITLSPDGKLVASGSDDCTVRIWDVISCELVHCMEEHITAIKAVMFIEHSNKTLLVSVSSDGNIIYWELRDGKFLVLARRQTSCSATNLVRKESDAHCVVGVKHLEIWDNKSMKRKKSLPLPWEADSGRVCLSSDQRTIVAIESSGKVIAWNLDKKESTEMLTSSHTHFANDLAVNIDRTHLFGIDVDGSPIAFNAESKSDIGLERHHNERILSVAISLDDSIALSISEGCIKSWRPNTGAQISNWTSKNLPEGSLYTQTRFGSFGWRNEPIVLLVQNQSIRVGTTQSPRPIASIDTDHAVSAASISSDGRILAYCLENGELCVVDIENKLNRLVLGTVADDEICFLGFAEKGYQAVALSQFGSISILNCQKTVTITSFEAPNATYFFTCANLDSSVGMFAAGTKLGAILLCTSDTLEIISEVSLFNCAISNVFLRGNLIIGAAENRIRVFDRNKMVVLGEFSTEWPITSCALGTCYLVIGDSGGFVHQFELNIASEFSD